MDATPDSPREDTSTVQTWDRIRCQLVLDADLNAEAVDPPPRPKTSQRAFPPAVSSRDASLGELSEPSPRWGGNLGKAPGHQGEQRDADHGGGTGREGFGEELQELAVLGIADGRQLLSEPPLEQQQVPVGRRQDAALHEQVAQVDDRSPRSELTRPLMGERDLVAGQGLQVPLNMGLVGPGQPSPRASYLPECVEQREEFGPDAARAVVEEFVETLGQDTSAADSASIASCFLSAPFAGEVAEATGAVGAELPAGRCEARGEPVDAAASAGSVGLQGLALQPAQR
ncbi:hypothetical protein ACFWP7_25770 [Streptomyces sp. NPDC058470]|uniref:hypothetical protein n=1 Tax=Streptomyces sp. NPDC058470 TaxID=3346515 RepID=UPI00365C6A2E